MYEELKIKTIVRKIANEYGFSYDDKILAYIQLFEREPKSRHNMIKNYMSEFAPVIWQEFNEYLTIKNMTNIVKNVTDDVQINESKSLDDLLNKLK